MATLPRSAASAGRSPGCGLGEALVEQLVDRGVDAADEEAGDAARAAAESPPPATNASSAGEIGLGHLLVDLLGEQQGDVDVDALADQLADGRQAGFGRRHLHHQIVAGDRAPEPPRFGDGGLGVEGEIGRDFEADEAVATAAGVVDRPQDIGGMPDIGDREAAR